MSLHTRKTYKSKSGLVMKNNILFIIIILITFILGTIVGIKYGKIYESRKFTTSITGNDFDECRKTMNNIEDDFRVKRQVQPQWCRTWWDNLTAEEKGQAGVTPPEPVTVPPAQPTAPQPMESVPPATAPQPLIPDEENPSETVPPAPPSTTPEVPDSGVTPNENEEHQPSTIPNEPVP